MRKCYHTMIAAGKIAASLLAIYCVGLVAYFHIDDMEWKKKQEARL